MVLRLEAEQWVYDVLEDADRSIWDTETDNFIYPIEVTRAAGSNAPVVKFGDDMYEIEVRRYYGDGYISE